MAKTRVIKAGTNVSVRKKPVKAGSTHTDKTGGIMTTKVIAIAKHIKKKGKHNG